MLLLGWPELELKVNGDGGVVIGKGAQREEEEEEEGAGG